MACVPRIPSEPIPVSTTERMSLPQFSAERAEQHVHGRTAGVLVRPLVQGGVHGLAGTAQAQVIIARCDIDGPRKNLHAVGGLDHAQWAQ